MLPRGLVDLLGDPGRTVIGVVPGFGSGPKGYGPLLHAINEQGHRVLFFPSQRRDPLGAQPHAAAYAPYPAAFARQAYGVLNTLTELRVDQIVLIGHSLGSPIATICGAINPSVVRRVINLCPACACKITRGQIIRGMAAKRTADRRYAQALPSDSPARHLAKIAEQEGWGYITANPPRAFGEAWAISEFNTVDLVAKHNLDAFYAVGARDPLFPASSVQAAVAHLDPARFIRVDCGHDPQNKKDEAAAVVRALQDLSLFDVA